MSGKVILVRDLTQLEGGDAYNPLTIAKAEYGAKNYTYHKFGYNAEVDPLAEEDIWDVGGSLTYLDTASNINFSSTSDDDSQVGVGVGLSAILVEGLDANYNFISEVIQLQGQAAIPAANQYIRIFRMRGVATNGVSANTSVAAGTISALSTPTITTQAQILAGETSTNMSHFTVPAGYEAIISSIYASAGPSDDAAISLMFRTPGTMFTTAGAIELSNSNLFTASYDPFLGFIPEATDLKFRGEAISQNASIRVGYSLLLMKINA